MQANITKQRNNIVLFLILALGGFLAWCLKDYIDAVLGAIMLYVLFRPFFIFLVEKKGLNSSLASFLVILTSFFIIILPVLFFSLMIVNKLLDFRKNPEVIKGIIHNLDVFVAKRLQQPHLLDKVLDKAQDSALGIFSYVLNGAASVILLLAILYLLLFFMFSGYRQFEDTVVKYMPFREKNSLRFAEELKFMTYSSVLGQGIVAVVQGILVVIGFLIFGLNDPIFWGLISMFLSFLPIVGAPTTMLVAGLIQLSNGQTWSGLGAIAWGLLLIGALDSVLRFLLAKRIGNIPPLITILGVILGIPVFGILGLVFGPLLLSYFILLIDIYEDNQLLMSRYERMKTLK